MARLIAAVVVASSGMRVSARPKLGEDVRPRRRCMDDGPTPRLLCWRPTCPASGLLLPLDRRESHQYSAVLPEICRPCAVHDLAGEDR